MKAIPLMFYKFKPFNTCCRKISAQYRFYIENVAHKVSKDHWGGFGLFEACASAVSAIWLTAWAVARTFKH